MKIKMVQDLAAWKDYRDLRKGEIYDLPPEDAQKLIKNGLAAEVIEEFLGDELAEKMKAEAKAPTLEPKRIVELKQGMRIKGEWWPPGRYEVPTQMPWSLSDWLLKNAPEKVEEIHVEVGKPAAQAGTEEEVQGPPPAPVEGGGPQKKVEIPPELAGWLSSKGFVLNPEGVAFVRTERLETGDIVKLLVDFTDTPKGTRFGYRLDLSKDPPEWKSDPNLRDHPLLLEYKRFRDDLLARREAERTKPPAGAAKPAEVPAGEGAKLALLSPEVEEAKEMERRDEEMIIRELKGELKEAVLSQYFYDFVHKGRRVVGLSYAGVKAAIRKMGRVDTTELKVEEKPDAWLVIVKAVDKVKDISAYGVAYQPKRFPSGEDNPFSLQVAVSKALRNCWRVFIDEKIVTEAWRAYLEEKERRERGGV
jgi:hypothetical protein